MNNPSAFPSGIACDPSGDLYGSKAVAQEGMTLRDYFAAHASTGLFSIISPGDFIKLSPEELRVRIAIGSYQIADAMLKERERTPTP